MQDNTLPIAFEHVKNLEYETPFFYTSREVLKQNYHLFVNTFTDAEIYYALKANSDPKILTYLDQLGCGFEAASAYEMDILLQLGVDSSKIIYGTSIKPASHIKRCFDAGVNRFAADSKEEIEKIAANAPGAKIYVRVVVDDSGSVFMMSERFGTPAETVKDLLLHARHLGLKTYGISFYVGSQAVNADRWAKGVQTVKPLLEDLLKEGITVEVLNIGGGFPVLYRNHRFAPQLHEITKTLNNALHTLPYVPKILMEPGRALVATSTILVTEVVARNNRGNMPWLCLDAGIYNALYEAMIHQGSTQYAVHPIAPPIYGAEPMICTLSGPTGDSLDVITRDAILPSYITVGDRLIFENTGAYTVSMASRFNGFPEPKLYMG